MSRRKMMMRRRRFFSALLIAALIVALGGGIYEKMHHIEYCQVLNVMNNTVFVRHSNGLTYMVVVEDPSSYVIGQTTKVVFDQLTDWEKYYTITDISPIK